MEKIINSHRYSTDTATLLGEYSNEYTVSDDLYIYEGLYLKTTGEFFLYCKGGPQTMYSKKVGNKRVFCEDIYLITYEQAQKWVKEHLSEEIFRQYFRLNGGVGITEMMKSYTVKLPVDYIRKLKILRAKYNMNYTDIFKKMIDDYIDKVD